MDKLMEEILSQLRALTNEVKGYGQKLKSLDSSINSIKEEHGQILSNLEATVNGMKEDQGQKLKTLEASVHNIIDEHGQILRNIQHNKEIRKIEFDNLKQEVSRFTGVLKGFDNSLEILKKAE